MGMTVDEHHRCYEARITVMQRKYDFSILVGNEGHECGLDLSIYLS